MKMKEFNADVNNLGRKEEQTSNSYGRRNVLQRLVCCKKLTHLVNTTSHARLLISAASAAAALAFTLTADGQFFTHRLE
jgi:hypothetical protein